MDHKPSERVELPGRLDPQVTHAVSVIRRLPAEASEEIITALYRSAYAFARTGDPAALVQLAEDALATISLHEHPDHETALLAAPRHPSGKGRSVKEVFAELRQ